MQTFLHWPMSAKLSTALVAAGLALAPGPTLAARYPNGPTTAHGHYYGGRAYERHGYRGYGPLGAVGAVGGLAAGAVVGTLAAPSGHYVQEEAPKETLEVMQKFFAD